MTKFYLAPMEGITGYIFRNAYHHNFSPMDKYFTPFISNKGLGKKELNDILPEHNKDMCVVPQILTNSVGHFLRITRELAKYGYDTVNINLGCPSGTVVSKKHGAGFLTVPDELDAFFEEIFEKSSFKISVKTRIGMEDEAEWEKIVEVYKKYPFEELIVHPRLRKDLYKGNVRITAYEYVCQNIDVPLCYNGDIVSKESCESFLRAFPDTKNVMTGRGILKNPALISDIKGENVQKPDKLIDFHEELLDGYRSIMSGDMNTLFKMKELWGYLGENFAGAQKQLKKIKKAQKISEYEEAVRSIFTDCEWKCV